MTEAGSTDTQERAGARRRFVMAGGLLVLVVAMGLGFLAATQGLRLPGKDPKRLSDVLSQAIETQGIDAAVAQYRNLREQGFPGLRESESDTNNLGYALLGEGQTESAIQVFRLNVEAHPASANVYDSLGEAYLATGNKVLAIESYQKAMAIDPKKKTAIAALQRLTNFKRAPYRPIVLFHISAGTLGLLSGAAAMALRKGSRRHGVVGNLFVVSTLCMSATGAYRAFVAPDGQVINVLMGVFTFYLVLTAWLTARRRKAETGLLDWGALVVVLAVAAGLVYYGLQAASSGHSGGLFLFFGAVALLAGVLDVRMILRGGLAGADRVARHLWRMCVALFIAVGSLFLGQQQVFPDAVRNSGLLGVPSLVVFVLLVFWLIRVLFTSAYRRTASPRPRIAVAEVATAPQPAQ